MKKYIAFILAALIIVISFAGCAEDKNSKDGTAADNENMVPADPNATNVDGKDTTDVSDPADTNDTPDIPAVPTGIKAGSDNTEDWEEYKIVYFGDGTFCANSMGDVLAALAETDGIKITAHARTYNNLGTLSTFNLYETCKYTGPKPKYKSAEITNGTTNNWQIENLKDADFFVMLSGRERSLVQGTDGNITRTKLALKAWYDKYNEVNPEGKLVLFVPYGFESTEGSSLWNRFSGIGLTYMPRAQHNEIIKQAAAELSEYIDNDCSMVQVGDAFESFIAQNNDIDLYDPLSERFPSKAGTYYSACVLYSSLFGKATEGMKVYYPGMDEATVLLIQKAADAYVRSTGKTLTPHGEDKTAGTPVPAVTDPRLVPADKQDARFANEVYPENYDVIMATLYAYDTRGIWVQYDNKAFDIVNETWRRRAVVNSEPEDGTPQSILYTDCSAFIYSAYMDTFGFGFDGGNRCADMIDKARYRKYFYDADDSDMSLEQAIAEFKAILQPGDVFVYTDYGNVAHTGVYVGGGQVIHSVGIHATGGGEDYNFNNCTDDWEYNGGIVWNHIDDFTESDRRFYMFKSNVDVGILRPLEYVGKPSENALNRLNNMMGILSYKHTTAPEGVTVSKGDEVTFTFVIENLNTESKTVDISDKIPTGLTYKSGEGKLENGKFTATVTLSAGETKKISYTVTVDADNGKVIAMDEAYIGGVRTNKTDITVGNTLKKDEQTKLIALLANGTAADDTYTLLSKAYADMGITLPQSVQSAIDGVFSITPAANGKKAYSTVVTGENASKMLASTLYGGKTTRCSQHMQTL